MKNASRFAVWVMLALSAGASEAADPPKYELWLGFGGAGSPEKSVFNVPNDIASVPEAAVSLGFLRNLNARSAIGLHLYGAAETTPEIPFQGASGSQPVRFDLATGNVGVRYRYAFARRNLVPYLFAGANLVGATIQSSATGEIGGYGASACIGPGLGVRLGRHFMLSAEGIASFGNANWEKLPASNSSSTKFDPSLLAGTVNLSVVWGTEPRATVPREPAVADSSPATAANGAPEVTAGRIVLFECMIVLLSTAAYADDRGGLLGGITAASALLGAAAGSTSDPASTKITFFGLISLAALEFTLGAVGASNDVLFATSVVGWNAVEYAAYRAERKAKSRQ
jgi:hypothetical protein